ncbi:MAG: thioredoxin fold domain-containing protein [Proteobacteria bacterium]|nr:thioredoxin fold domain-containing protein [Pseudomonadota bacterium]MBU1450727.1 thioredoxin fold domain-containing protein [Pseudomonadota bacterium]MBU2468666.1 thioredoxin fold domain-containing protein [Pseudomonadota bacterium]
MTTYVTLKRLGAALTAVAILSPALALAAGGTGAPSDPFAGQSFWLVLALVFLGGLALNLTPCVYPLIPITIGYFGGRSAGRGGLVADALAYWLGMAIMYAALGSLVALGGAFLGQALSHPAVIMFLAAVLLFMAASMFGLWELRLPASLNRMAASNRAGVLGALIMGLTLGLLAAPCVGPFVVGLMAHVAREGSVGYGLLVFFVLAAGLGLPLAVLAAFSGSIQRLPGAGEWMIWVRKFFGLVLIIMAVNIAEPLLGAGLARWLMILTGLAGGIYLGFMEKSGKGVFVSFKRVAGIIILAAAASFWWFWTPGGAPDKTAWVAYTPQVLQEAQDHKKPVALFFTADWCNPCKKLKSETLPQPEVQKLLAHFVPVKADFTSDPGPAAQKLMRQHRVRGVPTIIFLDGQGNEVGESRVVGFVPPKRFLSLLKMAVARTSATPGG